MDDMIPEYLEKHKDVKEFMMPFIAVLTAILWGEAWLEIISHDAWRSSHNLTKIYLAMMGAYAGAGEAQKWFQKNASDPADDTTLERMHRGGFFVALWLLPLLSSYVWGIFDQKVPMPGPLQDIATGLVIIFFVKAASRHVRHTHRGIGGAAADDSEIVEGQDELTVAVRQKILASPDGMKPAEIKAAFPDRHPRKILRALSNLIASGQVSRSGNPHTAEARYKAASDK
jgi:hypothetical protein